MGAPARPWPRRRGDDERARRPRASSRRRYRTRPRARTGASRARSLQRYGRRQLLMPSFTDAASCAAAPEEVWKLLYDPARFPAWWAGVETVDVQDDGKYTMYPDGYPDFPMAQVLDTRRDEQRVTVSCLVSDLRFEWH